MNDVTQFAADDRVETVVSGDGKTAVSTFFITVEIRPTKEPAAGALVDVSAQSREISNQGRCHTVGGVDEQWQPLIQLLRLDNLRQGHVGADRESILIGLDAAKLRYGGDVDKGIGQRHAGPSTQSFMTPATRSLPP